MTNNLLLYTLLVFLFTACQSAEAPTDTKADFANKTYTAPKLLDRHADLRQGTEWDQIQRLYVAQRNAITDQKDPADAALKLAQIFINEARITGEHGHYYPAALNVVDYGLGQLKEGENDTRFLLLSTKASVELSQHDFAKALATAEMAVQLNPYNAQIYGALVDAHVELGNYEKAVAMADKMVSIRPDLRSYSRVAYLREIHGDVEGAIAAMQLAIQAGFPGQEATSWTRLTLAEMYRTYGQAEKARQQYELALSERENYPFAIAGLAQLDMEAGNLDAAEKELKRAAAIIPEFGFYVDLAKIYKQRGQEKQLAETKAEILVMLQDDVDSGHRMDMEYADLYLDLFDDPAKALTYTQAEYKRRPANIDVNRMMAKIYHALGQADKAQPYQVAAGKTQSQHPDLLAMEG